MDRSVRKLALILLLLSASLMRSDTTFYDAVVWDFGSSLTINSGITARFLPGSTVDATGATLVGFPGGSGASSFLGLTDTPTSYTGQAGNFVAVNPGASGLVFVPAPSGGGGGTVTNFTAGNLAPLFTTAVGSPSTTPALTFSLSTVGAGLFFGNETGVTAAPHYVQPSFANLSGDFALTQTPSLAAGSLVGRTSTGSGDWQAIQLSGGLTMSGTTLSAGNVNNSGTPTVDQTAVFVDATHVKGVTALTGGNVGQVLKKLSSNPYDWVWAADQVGGAGGAGVFTDLGDVPASYVGSGGKLVAVNAGASGLEFITAPAGGVTSVFGRTGAVVATSGDYSAFYQPLDTDLTSIAALTTTAFGRGFLPLADATSARTYIGAGTSNFDGTFTSLTGKPTTIAGYGITDAYTKVQSDGLYQPIDADLTSLAGASLTNSLYYRSATSTWSAVTIGSNLTFGSGTLAAGNVNWDTAFTDRLKWDGGSAGLNAANGRTNLGLVIGTNVQAWGADLDALEALSGTNTIYYRSAANTWSPVVVGSGLTFTSGTLASLAGGGDVSSNTALSVDSEIALFSSTTGKVIKRATGNGIATLSAGVLGTITDNSANWNTAATDALKWNGQATGLVAGTGRTSLGATTVGSNLFTATTPTSTSWIKVGSAGAVTFEDANTTKTSLNLDQLTNDIQTKASILPNTVPTAGQIPVGNGTTYVPRTMSSGNSITVSLSSTGLLSISAIPNASLVNNSITVGNASSATALGGVVSADSITGATGLGYVKRTATNTYTATTTDIPNADLANADIQIGNAGTRTALGGSVGLDAITGMSGAASLVKRTAANTFANAVAGTDYKAATTASVIVKQITTTSTYTVPAAVISLYVECVGGGGGGGGYNVTGSGNSGATPGGGGGGYAAVYVASPAASYAITIGGGGAGGSSATGATGGTTSVGTICSATGGTGGAGSSGAGASGPVVWMGVPGADSTAGVGTIGTTKISGSDGSAGLSMSGISAIAGAGGGSHLAGATTGPSGSAGVAVAGYAGSLYGGGGSGCCITNGPNNRLGGAGAAGVVRIWEFY